MFSVPHYKLNLLFVMQSATAMPNCHVLKVSLYRKQRLFTPKCITRVWSVENNRALEFKNKGFSHLKV